jgi:predicted DNA binding CopG/RHH family protein
MAKKAMRQKPGERMIHVNLRMPQDMVARLKDRARAKGIGYQVLMREMLERELMRAGNF